MKKKVSLILLCGMMLLLVCGCEKNNNEASDNSNLPLYNTDSSVKNENVVERGNVVCSNLDNVKIIFENGLYLTYDNELYVISEQQKFSNEKNCKKVSDTFIVNSINVGDGMLGLVDEQNRIYTYNIINYNLVEEKNVNYIIKKFVSKKIYIKVEGRFALNNDGIIDIYNYDEFRLEDEKIVFENEKIVDFMLDISQNDIMVVKTDKAYYVRKKINKDECNKYADVECKYELVKDEYLSNNYNKISIFNPYMFDVNLIFKDGKIVMYDFE